MPLWVSSFCPHRFGITQPTEVWGQDLADLNNLTPPSASSSMGEASFTAGIDRAGRDGARNQHKEASSLSAVVRADYLEGLGGNKAARAQPRGLSCPAERRICSEICWHKSLGRGRKEPLEGASGLQKG